MIILYRILHPTNPSKVKDNVPSTCDLCDFKGELEYLSVKEDFTDGSIKHYTGWVCNECANIYEMNTVERFKRDNPDYKEI